MAVEYRITALGKTLRPPVDIILNWIEAYLPSIEDARRRFDEAMDGPSSTQEYEAMERMA